jgi:hypothetical protein
MCARISMRCGEPVTRVRPGDHTDPEFDREQANYLACPSAFWNRPDGDYLSDEPYVPVLRHYDPYTMQTYERPL